MRSSGATDQEYDFFISYTSADAPWARWVAWHARDGGYRVTLQAWDFLPGQSFVLRMNEAATHARRTLAIISPAFFASRYTPIEWASAFVADPTTARALLVPVRVREVDPPGLLQSISYVDLVGLDETAARTRLLDALSVVVAGTAVPERRPEFPAEAESVATPSPDRVEFPPLASQTRAEEAVHEAQTILDVEHDRRQSGQARRSVGLRLRRRDAVFFNREAARAALTNAITSPDIGLVLVIGPPGVGKTALASWVLARLEDEGSPVDGIVYLSARTQGLTFERLYNDVATLLGGEARQQLLARTTDLAEERIPELLVRLQDGAWVVLLDNLEDALDDAGEIIEPGLRLFVAEAVAGGSDVTIVVTSRREPAIPPGALLRSSRIEFEAELPEPMAVELLRRLDPDGRADLRDAPYEEVAQAGAIGYRIPRALELIAALRRLGAPLDDFYERGDVVRDLASSAMDTMDADSRRAVESLAAFGRAVRSEALQFMLAGELPGIDANALALEMARSGIVAIDPAQGTISLHPVDREVALRRMSSAVRCALHRRAAEWWNRLRVPRSRRLALADLEPHVEEFEQLMLAGDVDAAADVVSDLDSEYRVMGWDARLVAALRSRLEDKLVDPRRRMRHEFGLGQAHIVLGPSDQPIARFQSAAGIARELGDESFERTCLSWLGNAYRFAGDHETAMSVSGRALERHRRAGDEAAETEWLPAYALAAVYAGDPDVAEQAARAALDRAPNDAAVAAALDSLALAEYARGRWEQAIAYAEQSISLYGRVGILDGAGYTENVLGMARFRSGDRDGARRALEHAGELGAEMGSARLEGFAAFNLARVLDERSARPYADRAQTLLVATGGQAHAAAEALVRALDPAANSVSRQEALTTASTAAGDVPDLLA